MNPFTQTPPFGQMPVPQNPTGPPPGQEQIVGLVRQVVANELGPVKQAIGHHDDRVRAIETFLANKPADKTATENQSLFSRNEARALFLLEKGIISPYDLLKRMEGFEDLAADIPSLMPDFGPEPVE